MTPDSTPGFAMVDLVTDRIVYADTLGDLVAEIVDDYPITTGPEKDDERLAARADTLAVIAHRAQAAILASVGTADISEDALTVLMHDRSSEVLQMTEWDSNIPLLLLATSYAPYTDTPAPSGDAVVMLDAHTERTFLDALASVGAVELFIHDGSD